LLKSYDPENLFGNFWVKRNFGLDLSERIYKKWEREINLPKEKTKYAIFLIRAIKRIYSKIMHSAFVKFQLNCMMNYEQNNSMTESAEIFDEANAVQRIRMSNYKVFF